MTASVCTRAMLWSLIMMLCFSIALWAGGPCTVPSGGGTPLSAAGYTLSEGGDTVEGFGLYDIDRASDGIDMGSLRLMKFCDNAPAAAVDGIVQRFTSANVGTQGRPASEVDVDGVLWHHLDHGTPEGMHEWYRYSEPLHAVIQYMQPVASVSREGALGFLAAFDLRNRRYVPILADFTPVPGYAFREGDELFKSVVLYDVDRISDDLDMGAIVVHGFDASTPEAMKARAIDRFTKELFEMPESRATEVTVNGVPWYYSRHGAVAEWHRYDEELDAVLEYAYVTARVTEKDAMAFLAALDSRSGIPVPAARSDGRSTDSVSYLFVQEAQSGRLIDNCDGSYSLTLIGVADSTVVFADRPVRDAFTTTTAEFAREFGLRFAGDPPNAALTFDLGDGASPGVAVFTISAPKYDRATRTLVYRAVDLPLSGTGLAQLPRAFRSASLFIDTFVKLPGTGIGPVETWSLAVTVQDAGGNPIAGAVIGTEGTSGTSDSHGTVTLTGALGTLPSSVTATLNGTDVLAGTSAFTWSGGSYPNEGTVTVTVNDSPAPAAGIGPVQTWSLAVTVQDATGNSVAGVVIGAEGTSGTTDSQGAVTLTGALGTLPSSVTATLNGADVLAGTSAFTWSGGSYPNEGTVMVTVDTGT